MNKIRLIDAGRDKLQIIKLVKSYTNKGLKESKDLVDQTPSEFYIENELLGIGQILKDFEHYGARVELVEPLIEPLESPLPEKNYYVIKLLDPGPSILEIIKIIRKHTNLGLKECKDLVENPPAIFEIHDSQNSLSEIISEFEKAGAKVEEATDKEKFASIKTQSKSTNTFEGGFKAMSAKSFSGASGFEKKDDSSFFSINQHTTKQEAKKNIGIPTKKAEFTGHGVDAKPNLKQVLVFANTAALLLPAFGLLLNLSFFGTDFIVALIIAYLLSKYNAASKKLGLFAILVVFNYFVVKGVVDDLFFSFYYGYQPDMDSFFILEKVIYSFNINSIISATLVWLIATNSSILKTIQIIKQPEISPKIPKVENHDKYVKEHKEIVPRKKKLKF
jgi:ribosomal protein L7/L12